MGWAVLSVLLGGDVTSGSIVPVLLVESMTDGDILDEGAKVGGLVEVGAVEMVGAGLVDGTDDGGLEDDGAGVNESVTKL